MDLIKKAIKSGYIDKIITGKTKELTHYYVLCDIQKWLREEHNIHIAILPKQLPNNSIVYYVFKGKLKKDFNNLYKTYEEALEIGLLVALNLI